MCALSLEKKSEIIKSYQTALENAKMAILTTYSGSSVQQFDMVRSELREQGAKVFVVKNTLLKRAVEGTHFEKFSDELDGPLALVASDEDMVGPSKVMDKCFTDEVFKFEFKAAIGEDSEELLAVADIQALAKLPSREVLLGRLAGSLVSPIRGVMGVLQALPRNLVYALSQISKKSE